MNPAEDKVQIAFQKLDDLDMDEMNKIRRDRLDQLKKEMKSKEEWKANGHGDYTTLSSEKEFFESLKKSQRVVLHCYRSSTIRCAIVDKHFDILAKSHIETKFCKLDVEKAPFLCERLGISVIPTILLCTGGKDIETIVGFDDLGGSDDFPIQMLEWRIATAGMINYDGDLTSPPGVQFPKKSQHSIFTIVRENIKDDDDDSDSDGQGDH